MPVILIRKICPFGNPGEVVTAIFMVNFTCKFIDIQPSHLLPAEET
jgi:hypothetical protein